MTDREAMRLALDALENHTAIKHPQQMHYRDTAIEALRQALDHVPDTTKMIEPDMGIDRGAWDDVPDATKWVDELRGGDEPLDTSDMAHRTGGLSMEQSTECVEPVAWLSRDDARLALWDAINKREFGNPTDDKLILDHLRKNGLWIGKYTSPPASKPWVGLTDVEWMNIVNKDHAWFGQRPEDVAHEVAKLVEAKLKEKNT